jgi:hypothetical protein
MLKQDKRLNTLLVVFVSVCLLFLAVVVWVKDSLAIDKTGSSINKKIESAEQKIADERYRMRLKEAIIYLQRGDNYNAKGRTQEALVEWSTSLALLELLKDTSLESVDDARLILEQEIKDRFETKEVKEIVSDEGKLKAIEQKIEIILRAQAQKEKAQNLQSAKTELPSQEKKFSVGDLDKIKKDRQAVEEKIAKEMGKEQEVPKQEIVKNPEEQKITQVATVEQVGTFAAKPDQALKSEMEESIIRERKEAKKQKTVLFKKSEAKIPQEEKAAPVREDKAEIEKRDKAREQAIEAILTKDKEKQAALKTKVEQAITNEQKQEEGNIEKVKQKENLDRQLKEQAEKSIQNDIIQEARQRKELKAQMELKQAENIKAEQKKAKVHAVDNNLKQLENIESAGKKNTGDQPDSFDKIDRLLRSIEKRCFD